MNKLTVSMRHYEATLGAIYIFLQVFLVPVALVTINTFLPQPFSFAELNFINFAFNFICVTCIFHHYLTESFKVVIRHSGRSIITYLKALALYWISSILISHLILYLDPSFANVNDENIASLADQNYPLMTIGAVLLVPIVEETLYRGVVFGKLYQKNIPLAYCVSIAVFSALHVVEYIGVYPSFKLLLCFLQYIPAGLFLAWSYVKSDTIWVPIFIHMTLNLIGMLAM